MATRLKVVLPYLIDECQTRYMEGRFIGTNIKKNWYYRIFRTAKANHVIHFYQVQKCYDTVELSGAIFKLVIIWSALLGCSTIALRPVWLIMVNAVRAPEVYIGGGGRIRISLSPGGASTNWFGKIRLKNTRNSNQKCNRTHIIICRWYRSFFSSNYESLQAIIENFLIFQANTGLKANFNKSTIYMIGWSEYFIPFEVSQPFKWSREIINVLGVRVASSNQEVENFSTILQK